MVYYLLILNYKGFICELSVVPHNTEGKNSDCLLKKVGRYGLNWAQSTTNQKKSQKLISN